MKRGLACFLASLALGFGQAYVNTRPLESGDVVYRAPARPAPPPAAPYKAPPRQAVDPPKEGGSAERESRARGTEALGLPPGRFFEALLVTGVMAPAGGETPVLARSTRWCEAPPCAPLFLVGTARLHETGRAVIEFRTAVLEGEPFGVLAVGFDFKDKLFGVRGQVMDVAPSLALDLVRASIGGLSDWVQAMVEARKVVVTTNGVVQEQQVPEAWTFPLAAAARTIKPPANTTALIRAVVLGAGEPIRVLTLPSAPPQAGSVAALAAPSPSSGSLQGTPSPTDVLKLFIDKAQGP